MQKDNSGSAVKTIIGMILAFAAALLILPWLLEKVSSLMYKKLPRKQIVLEDDDWGPVIVKKRKDKED